jgi:hypothetical protein
MVPCFTAAFACSAAAFPCSAAVSLCLHNYKFVNVIYLNYFRLPANHWLPPSCHSFVLLYIKLVNPIVGYSYISLPLMRLRYLMSDLISISNHEIESFLKMARVRIFLQCSMLAHQSARKIQESIVIEVIYNNLDISRINETKYL